MNFIHFNQNSAPTFLASLLQYNFCSISPPGSKILGIMIRSLRFGF